MGGWADGQMDGWVDGWMVDGQMDGAFPIIAGFALSTDPLLFPNMLVISLTQG